MYDDPTPSAQQAHNFPYTWLGLPGGEFLVGTNLGEVYRVGGGGITTVHKWDASTSWQPYTMVNYFDSVVVGQYPTGGVFYYSPGNGSLAFPDDNVGVEPGASPVHR